jgi:anti-sigma regulatory factor (Ser/Thr protein kinase)
MVTMSHSGAEAVLFLRMHSSWNVVDDIRRFVEQFCATACPEAKREEQLALATHELVQNAIANAATPDIDVKLELARRTGRVTISVSNDAREDQIEILRERLGRTVAHANPLQGYLAAMKEDPHSRGGIGLARIRFEAALELDLEVAGGRITMHATGPLAAPDFAATVA